MDAETFQRTFRQDRIFGRIDTQELRHAGPAQIKEEVRRVRAAGPHFIASPSHEAIPPDVPPEWRPAEAAPKINLEYTKPMPTKAISLLPEFREYV
jgi:hypothetical protein